MTTDRTPSPASRRPAGRSQSSSTSRPRRPLGRRVAAALLVVGALLAVVGCGSGSSRDGASVGSVPPVLVDGTLPRFGEGTVLRVIAHDSFAVSTAVLDQFTAETGVKVEILTQGDAGTMVNAAILTRDAPQGDLLFGIDENLLTAAFDAGLFQPYRASRLDGVDPSYRVDDQHRVTPIDHGDVCVNFDRAWYSAGSAPVPQQFEDLADPATRSQLVVEDPTSSSPGLAFLLATIARFGGGDDTSSGAAWLDYWRSLKANDVRVVDGWEQAYYGSFSGSSGEGDRPLVVSYSSSPPAEVTDTSLAVDATPTGVLPDTCYRQIEFAGVLAGAAEPDAARAFIEFMLGEAFQQDLPDQMYVYPVVRGTTVSEVFAKYTTSVPEPLTLPFAEVAANRERWIAQWASVFR
ncbi:MAG: thiamine ABC transporter substrate-binding protein [Acidobacteria bacterium]|nr:thiamine ABC transporter substrate-binding protein [Acidobacteriota bacterium]